jgi:hypothetical protein
MIGTPSPVVMRVVALLPLLAMMPIGCLSRETIDWPLLNGMIVAAGVTLIAASWWSLAPRQGALKSMPPALRGRAASAILVAAVAILSSGVARRAFSTPLVPDTPSYWTTWAELVKKPADGAGIRTLVYPALIATVHGLGGSGSALLLVQVVARAASCGAVAWGLGRGRTLTGAAVGLLLAVDPVASAASVQYLSESLFTSGLTSGVALVAVQMEEAIVPNRMRSWLTGAVIGLGLSVRPVGLGLVVPTLGAIGLKARSILAPLNVAVGVAAVVGSQMLFNLFRAGRPLLLSSGLFLAFPLFIHGLFDSQNGPASKRLGDAIERCGLRKEARTVTLATANLFVHAQLSPCLERLLGGDRERMYDLYGDAYKEAARGRPMAFAQAMAGETAEFLGYPMADYLVEMASRSEEIDINHLCARRGQYPQALLQFVCPLPRVDLALQSFAMRFARHTRLVYQPYLIYYYPDWLVGTPARPTRQEAGLGAIAFLLLVLAISPSELRIWVGGAAVVIIFIAVTTALGQVTMLRYVSVLSPCHLLVSGCGAVAVADRIWAVLVNRASE